MEIKFDLKIVAVSLLFYLSLSRVEAAAFGNSDFSFVVKSKYYIDKTLLIKDFLNDDDPDDALVKIITAPTRYGKSTVIDMLKRFLAIPTDSNGKEISLDTTDNYRLFCQPKLKICKNETFIKKHMGQYPVIHVNYSPLETIRNFDTLLNELRLTIQETFLQHIYLSQNSSLFLTATSKNMFVNHCDVEAVYTLTESHIRNAFHYLSQLLFQHFGRKVILLLDEYDAYCSNLLFGEVEDKSNIIRILGGISKSVFKYNNYLKKALLTGVLRVTGIGVSPTGNNMEDYRWLGDHVFSKYYGFTEEEVVKLIKANVEDETKRNKIHEVVDSYYDGYRIQSQRTKIYSMWSVIKFFRNNMKAESYWVIASYFKWIERFAKQYVDIFNDIKELVLTGSYVHADISKPLNVDDIMEFQRMPETMESVESFTRLLFDLGYLTETDIKPNDGHILEIPSNEIHMEFCKLLIHIYAIKYNFKSNKIINIHSVINSFNPSQDNTKLYKELFQTLNQIIFNSEHYSMTENDFQSFFFMTIASTFPIGKQSTTEMPTSFTQNSNFAIPKTLNETAEAILKKSKDRFNTGNIVRGRIDIVVANDHDMLIIFEIKFKGSETKKELYNLAKEGLCQALLTYEPHLQKNPIKFLKTNTTIHAKEIIYIGIAYDMESRNVSMALYNPYFDIEPSFLSNHNNVKSGNSKFGKFT